MDKKIIFCLGIFVFFESGSVFAQPPKFAQNTPTKGWNGFSNFFKGGPLEGFVAGFCNISMNPDSFFIDPYTPNLQETILDIEDLVDRKDQPLLLALQINAKLYLARIYAQNPKEFESEILSNHSKLCDSYLSSQAVEKVRGPFFDQLITTVWHPALVEKYFFEKRIYPKRPIYRS